MSNREHDLTAQDEQAPFGTQPRRSMAPLWLWGALYVAWFCFLLWMAIAYSGY